MLDAARRRFFAILKKPQLVFNNPPPPAERGFKLWHVSCRREKSLLSRSVHNLEDMRREMYHMHRALLKERSKCRALEDELQNPQNVHRWRKLEVRSW